MMWITSFGLHKALTFTLSMALMKGALFPTNLVESPSKRKFLQEKGFYIFSTSLKKLQELKFDVFASHCKSSVLS